MTKEEMLADINNENYVQVQGLIHQAMKRGAKEETFCMIDQDPKEGWEITEETLDRLREDGFEIEPYFNRLGIHDGCYTVKW